MSFHGQAVHGHANGGYNPFITGSCMVSFAGLFVLLRCWHRYVTSKCCSGPQGRRQFRLDDFMICLALVTSVCLTTLMNVAVIHGYGQHSKDLTEKQLQASLKYFYFAEIFFWLCCGLTKISMILLYQRIFQSHFRKIGIFCLGIAIIWLHLTVLLSVFQCQPISAVWNTAVAEDPGTKCVPRIVLSDTLAVINTLMHCLLFVLPIFPLRRLNLPSRQTKVLFITFGVCALAGGFSLYRTVCVLRHQMLFGDPTWTGACQAMCDTLEANIAIICPCLPMVPSLLTYYFPNLRLLGDYRQPGRDCSTRGEDKNMITDSSLMSQTDDSLFGPSECSRNSLPPPDYAASMMHEPSPPCANGQVKQGWRQSTDARASYGWKIEAGKPPQTHWHGL